MDRDFHEIQRAIGGLEATMKANQNWLQNLSDRHREKAQQDAEFRERVLATLLSIETKQQGHNEQIEEFQTISEAHRRAKWFGMGVVMAFSILGGAAASLGVDIIERLRPGGAP